MFIVSVVICDYALYTALINTPHWGQNSV